MMILLDVAPKTSDVVMGIMYLSMGIFALWALSRIPPEAIERFLKTLLVIGVLLVIFLVMSGFFQHQYPGK